MIEDEVQKAKESFENVLLNEKYSKIIKDDGHLNLLLSMLPIEHGNTILDVGTGSGYLAFPLAQGNKGCQVIGLDIAEYIIHLKKKVLMLLLPGMRFIIFRTSGRQ